LRTQSTQAPIKVTHKKMGDLPPTSGSETYETDSAEGNPPRFRLGTTRPWEPGPDYQLRIASEQMRDARRNLAARRALRERREQRVQEDMINSFEWRNPRTERSRIYAENQVGRILPNRLTAVTFNMMGGNIPVDPITVANNRPGTASFRVVNPAAAVPPEWRELPERVPPARVRRISRPIPRYGGPPAARVAELPAYPREHRIRTAELRRTLSRAEQRLRNRQNNRIFEPDDVELTTPAQHAFHNMTGADSDVEFDTDISLEGNRF